MGFKNVCVSFIYTQTHRHTDTQAHRHTDTQTHRHSPTPHVHSSPQTKEMGFWAGVLFVLLPNVAKRTTLCCRKLPIWTTHKTIVSVTDGQTKKVACFAHTCDVCLFSLLALFFSSASFAPSTINPSSHPSLHLSLPLTHSLTHSPPPSLSHSLTHTHTLSINPSIHPSPSPSLSLTYSLSLSPSLSPPSLFFS